MRRTLRRVAIAGVSALGLAAAGAAYVALAPLPRHPVPRIEFPADLTPERVARGKRAVQTLCTNCHLDPDTGALTGKRMPDLPPQFGESWSRNITAHPVKGIGSWTDGEIAYLLRTGVSRDGRYTPPWMIKLPNTSLALCVWTDDPGRRLPQHRLAHPHRGPRGGWARGLGGRSTPDYDDQGYVRARSPRLDGLAALL
jgi:hypothetical protein